MGGTKAPQNCILCILNSWMTKSSSASEKKLESSENWLSELKVTDTARAKKHPPEKKNHVYFSGSLLHTHSLSHSRSLFPACLVL